MKYVKGFKKDDYLRGDVNKEFDTMEQAAKYYSEKHGISIEDAIERIKNDTNCDAIYFDDGSVIINEYICENDCGGYIVTTFKEGYDADH